MGTPKASIFGRIFCDKAEQKLGEAPGNDGDPTVEHPLADLHLALRGLRIDGFLGAALQ